MLLTPVDLTGMQVNNIMRHVPSVTIDRITLAEPNIFRYLSLPTCSYSHGAVADIETILISGKVEHLPFVEAFDTVILINVIEHVSDLFAFLSSVYRSLKPRGLLIFHERWHDDPDASSCVIGEFEMHPIRVRRPALEHFLSLFDPEEEALYYSVKYAPNINCEESYLETSYYVATRKL